MCIMHVLSPIATFCCVLLACLMHMGYALHMRRSPLRHTLAVLRNTIGMGQKEMAELVGRSTRTIQAIELGQLQLSEDLAMRIAAETGIEVGWLLENDLSKPPIGRMANGVDRSLHPYDRRIFEWYRAWKETPLATEEQKKAKLEQLAATGELHFGMSDIKRSRKEETAEPWKPYDKWLVSAMQCIIATSALSDYKELIHWKLNKALQEIAKEQSIELPPLPDPLAKPVKGNKRKRGVK